MLYSSKLAMLNLPDIFVTIAESFSNVSFIFGAMSLHK